MTVECRTEAMASVQLRALERSDLDRGYLTLLSQLTTIGEATQEDVEQRFCEIANSEDYRILIAEDCASRRIVATGTVFIERKFIHGCGKVGHIEDVVVDASCRGAGVGKQLIEALMQWAQDKGCYKVILDCTEGNSGFYEKCGMRQKEIQMVKYFEQDHFGRRLMFP